MQKFSSPEVIVPGLNTGSTVICATPFAHWLFAPLVTLHAYVRFAVNPDGASNVEAVAPEIDVQPVNAAVAIGAAIILPLIPNNANPILLKTLKNFGVGAFARATIFIINTFF